MNTPTTTPTNTSNGTGSSRVALIVIGVVLAVVSLAAVAAGGILVGAHVSQRDADGYYASGSTHLATPTRAFVSDEIEIDGNGPNRVFDRGRLGTLRLTASGTAARPVFVGIAPRDQVDGYLRNVPRERITDFDLHPFEVTSTQRQPGTAVPAPPAAQLFWTDSATGVGEQSIEWPVQKGDWAFVVMNASGAPGVATDVSVGAKIGLLLWIGVGLVIFGLLLLAAGILAIVTGRRRSRAGRPAPAPSAPIDRLVAEGTC